MVAVHLPSPRGMGRQPHSDGMIFIYAIFCYCPSVQTNHDMCAQLYMKTAFLSCLEAGVSVGCLYFQYLK